MIHLSLSQSFWVFVLKPAVSLQHASPLYIMLLLLLLIIDLQKALVLIGQGKGTCRVDW